MVTGGQDSNVTKFAEQWNSSLPGLKENFGGGRKSKSVKPKHRFRAQLPWVLNEPSIDHDDSRSPRRDHYQMEQ